MTKCRQYALTGCLKDTTLRDCKIDKNIVSKCFNDLSDESETWCHKQDIIKSQGSLIRLLMPNHVFSSLDEDTVRTFKEKHDIATKCMKHMSIGETVCGSNCSTYILCYNVFILQTRFKLQQ